MRRGLRENLSNTGSVKMASTSKKVADLISDGYEPSARERDVGKRFFERLRSKSSVRLKRTTVNGRAELTHDHAEKIIGHALLMDALGTADQDFGAYVLDQLASLSLHNGEVDEIRLNLLFSTIKGIGPRDEVETMLAVQMATVHDLSLKSARYLLHAENIPQQDSAERTVNKLMRTFVTQIEALKRYRSGGEQKVTVQHVSVGEGGQAIVGNVTQEAPKRPNKRPAAASPLALSHDQAAPMPIMQEKKQPEPVAQKRGRVR